MRALIQRVTRASVTVDRQVTGEIEQGLLILLGVGHDDSDAQVRKLVDKVVNLRIFNDDAGKFDRSLLDVRGGALVVSQFTLFADCRKGRRPSFSNAARPEHASPLCETFVTALRDAGVQQVATGVFGAHMDVELCNDGPVTIWLDTDE